MIDLTVTQLLLISAVALFAAIACAWQIRRAMRDDYRTRNDRRAAWRLLRTTPPAEQQTPGTDTDLLLDAALTYYGPAGLQRLHTAITDSRKDKP